jgi:UDP-N-acetylmuramate--alanine ligase
VVTTALGVDADVAASALAEFRGVGRRFEHRGHAGGVTFVDDYAHLPSEVAAVVTAARGGGWDRVVAVFQPHRYTRIADVGADFGDSFVGADVVVVTGIFAAGQAPISGVTGRIVSEAVRAAHPHARVRYCETREELVSLLVDELRPGDLCLTMNAGDLTTLPDELLASSRFSERT